MLTPLNQKQLDFVRDVIQSAHICASICDLQQRALNVQRAFNNVAADVVYELRKPEQYLNAYVFDRTIRELEAVVDDAKSVLDALVSYRDADFIKGRL